MRRLLTPSGVLLVTLLFTLELGSGQALAAQFNYWWNTNDYVGYCGDQSGGYVLAVQQYERSLGSNKTAEDNYFGPNTYNGLTALQRYYGIPADGCAGPQTWSYMHTSLQSRCAPGYACYPDPNANYVISLGYTTQYFSYSSGCDWAPFTSGNPVAGPVYQNTYYGFDQRLTGQVCGA